MTSITPVFDLRKDCSCFIHPGLLTLFKEDGTALYATPSGRVISDSFSPRQLGLYNFHKTIPFSNRPIGVFSDSSLRVADLVKGEIIFSVHNPRYCPADFAVSSDDRSALAAYYKHFEMIDLRNGKISLSVPHGARAVALSHCGQKALSVSNSSTEIHLWDIRKKMQPQDSFSCPPCDSVAFSPDDRSILSEHAWSYRNIGEDKDSPQKAILLWNLKAKTSTWLSEYSHSYSGGLNPWSHFSPDGKHIAFLNSDKQIKLQSFSNPENHIILEFDSPIQSFSFSSDDEKCLLVATKFTGSSGPDIATWQVLDDQGNLLRAQPKTPIFSSTKTKAL